MQGLANGVIQLTDFGPGLGYGQNRFSIFGIRDIFPGHDLELVAGDFMDATDLVQQVKAPRHVSLGHGLDTSPIGLDAF